MSFEREDVREGVRVLFAEAQEKGARKAHGFLGLFMHVIHVVPYQTPRVIAWGAPPPQTKTLTCDRCGGVLEVREGVKWPVHLGRCTFGRAA